MGLTPAKDSLWWRGGSGEVRHVTQVTHRRMYHSEHETLAPRNVVHMLI